jgi:hypothetical protein
MNVVIHESSWILAWLPCIVVDHEQSGGERGREGGERGSDFRKRCVSKGRVEFQFSLFAPQKFLYLCFTLVPLIRTLNSRNWWKFRISIERYLFQTALLFRDRSLYGEHAIVLCSHFAWRKSAHNFVGLIWQVGSLNWHIQFTSDRIFVVYVSWMDN